MALTKLQCDHSACPPDKARVRLTDEYGMHLEVTPGGAKYWRMRYRFGGKEKTLGWASIPRSPWPRRASGATRPAKRYADPVQLRRDRKQKQIAEVENTFEVVARAWFEHWRGARTERHSGYVMRRLELDMFPTIGRLPIRQLTAPHVVQAVLAIQKRDAMDVAKRCWNTTGQILRYAVVYGHIDRNPMDGLKPSDALKPTRKENYARLDAREMPEFLRKIEGYQGTSITRLAMKLLALTLCVLAS